MMRAKEDTLTWEFESPRGFDFDPLDVTKEEEEEIPSESSLLPDGKK